MIMTIVWVSFMPKSKNISAVRMPMIGGRYSRNGRSFLPGLHLRLSISVPMIGSLIASQRVLMLVIQPVFSGLMPITAFRKTNSRCDTKL